MLNFNKNFSMPFNDPFNPNIMFNQFANLSVFSKSNSLLFKIKL